MPSKQDPVKHIKAALTERCHIDPIKTQVDVRMDGDCLIIEGTVDRISQAVGWAVPTIYMRI